MSKRVLVVDDEKLIVKGIRFSLEQDGMDVDAASGAVCGRNAAASTSLALSWYCSSFAASSRVSRSIFGVMAIFASQRGT